MKKISRYFASLLVFTFLLSVAAVAQEEAEPQGPVYITVTTAHWDMEAEQGAFKDWLETEKEYFDKVVSNNELIISSNVLTHYYTADNSEVKFIYVYASWEDIEKGGDRNFELAKEAWPELEDRRAFFKKQSSYYSNMHSDELYISTPGAKFHENTPGREPYIYYARVSHIADNPDGSNKEIQELRAEYIDAVINKNPLVKGYYPHRHLWGSDSRDFVEVFVVESLGDIEKAQDENWNLVKAHWPDEAKRKEFFSKVNSYFTGWHADYIYTDVPELSK